jgi:hypothetical protein
MTRAEPTLRSVPQAAMVAQILGRALAASALQPAKPVSIPVDVLVDNNAHAPATA